MRARIWLAIEAALLCGCVGLRAWQDSLPTCVLREADATLDLAGGCVDGVCLGDPFSSAVQAWGAPGCTTTPDTISCNFMNGVFVDVVRHGARDTPADDDAASCLIVAVPYQGVTPDGLGPGESIACFIDALGQPDAHGYDWGNTATWMSPNVGVRDAPAPTAGDGLADTVAMPATCP